MHQRDRRGILLLSSVLLAAACSDTTSNSGPTGSAGQTGTSGSTATGGMTGAAGSSALSGSGGSAVGTAGTQAGSSVGGGGGASAAGTSSGGAAGASVAGASGVAGAGTGGAVGTGCKGATVCYDFEECATPAGWTVPTFNTGEGHMGAGSTVVDKDKAHGGMCSLHMKDFSGDQPQHAYLADLPASFGPVMWGSAWVYNTSAPTNHGALIKARYSIPNSTDQDWYEVGYEQKNFNGQWHNPLPPSGLPEWILRSSTPLALNTWQCVEWLFDAKNGDMPQAADPIMWVDGQQITFGPGIEYDLTEQTGLPRPTTPKGDNFVSLEIGLTMYHTLDALSQFYVDDLAFGKTRVGCTP